MTPEAQADWTALTLVTLMWFGAGLIAHEAVETGSQMMWGFAASLTGLVLALTVSFATRGHRR